MNNHAIVITYNEKDGACAAAAALRKFPDAEILPASAYSVHKVFHEITGYDNLPGIIIVCGVGIYEGLDELCSSLDILRDNQVQVIWCSGKGLLKSIQKRLSKHCELAFFCEVTNTDAVIKYLKIDSSDKNIQLITSIALAKDGQKNKEVQTWIYLIDSCLDLYFKFCDRDAYPYVITKLSKNDSFVQKDQDMINRYLDKNKVEYLTGRSKAIKDVKHKIGKIAKYTNSTVMINGESGAGKELVARLIHEGSPRRKGEFCPVNCATLPTSELLNSRLFGHVKGSFTGAVSDRQGLFEIAHGGTLFLDEIGEMPLDSQAYLLRVLEEHKISRVGNDKTQIEVDTRIITATNRNLMQMVNDGTFRRDLYYRLRVIHLSIPPLRDRLEDLDLLVPELLVRLKEKLKINSIDFSKSQIELLKTYDWPGNIRQLFSFLESAIVCDNVNNIQELLENEKALDAVGNETTAHMLTKMNNSGLGFKVSQNHIQNSNSKQIMALKQMTQHYALQVLQLCENNQAKAARTLGITVNTLKRHIKGE